MKFPNDRGVLLLIQLVVAYEWFFAGLGKIRGGEFVEGIGKSLARFASENPYGWYKSFLEGFAARHTTTFGYLVQYGELLVGLVLAGSSFWFLFARSKRGTRTGAWLTVVALFFGALMSANFYFAAGWTSASTHGVNMLLFWVQVILLMAWTTGLRSEVRK